MTKAELDLLETVDLMLLRSLLGAPKTTPKEMLFLELGVMPLRDIIRQRRLNYLHYILNQGAESMMFKAFENQCSDRTSKDWVSTVLNDLEELGLDVTFADIQEMNKLKWKNTVKRSIREQVFEKLNRVKQTHSKVNDLNHSKLEMQKYFLPTQYEVTKEEIQVIFKLRSRVMRVKMNMMGLYDTYEW